METYKELHSQYLAELAENPKAYENWQIQHYDGEWFDCYCEGWLGESTIYRRNPDAPQFVPNVDQANTSKRHPKYDLYFAAIEGQQMQMRHLGYEWKDVNADCAIYNICSSIAQIRIKPPEPKTRPIQYRLWTSGGGAIHMWNHINNIEQAYIEQLDTFVDWVTPTIFIDVQV
jgi:hypothetical protein